MLRKARINFRARSPLSGLQIRISSQSAQDWPPLLFFAWEILNTELEVPDVKARSVILETVLAARRCIAAQNKLLSDLATIRTRRRLKTACSRVPNCIKRGPAALRRNLNRALLPLLEEAIDLEVLESILETTRTIFEAFPDNEPSCAALKSLKGVYFAGLPTTAQANAREATARFKSANNENRTAVHLFIAIGAAIKRGNTAKTSTQVGNLIVRYVAEIAAIWRRAELKQLEPSRARRYLDLNPTIYRSRFHQFAELVLLAMTRPAAGHSGKSSKNDVENAPGPAMPRGFRPWIEASRKGKKYRWLVSDNHLKRALGHGPQK